MKQIVFDMDGVLFATEALSDRLWKEMMEERGTPEMTAALQQCRGRNRTDTRAFRKPLSRFSLYRHGN